MVQLKLPYEYEKHQEYQRFNSCMVQLKFDFPLGLKVDSNKVLIPVWCN